MNTEKHPLKQIHITEDQMIHLPLAKYTNNALIQTLQNHYERLAFESAGDGSFVLLTGQLNEDDRNDLELDLEFYYRNPNLPLENLCSRLNNYHPQNLTQEELLRHAKALIDLEGSHVAAGLFIYGLPGVGKTHVAVGTAKEFMRKGINANYINLQPRYTGSHRYIINGDDVKHFIPGQAWIIDDLNSPFSIAMKIFKVIVLNTHNYGGRLFVTSNVSYDYLMEYGFVTDLGEKERFIDRVKGMFALLQIDGGSQRTKTAWYNRMQQEKEALDEE